MPRLSTLVLLFIAAILCGSIFAADNSLGAPPAKVGLHIGTQPAAQSLSKMPLSFTKNMGQWDDSVLFRANSGGATIWFTRDGITYQFTRRIPSPPSPLPVGEGWSKTGVREMGHSRASRNPGVGQNRFGFDASDPRTGAPQLAVGRDPFDRFDNTRDSIEQLILIAKFVNANPNPEIFAEGQMEYKCNYFIGNDPAKWHTDVPNYEAITLKDIYPGIDLKYSGDANGQATYEFIAAPGADIAQIKVAYDGAEETSIDTEGKLILKTKWGDMTAGMDSPRPVGEGSGVRAVLPGSTSCAWWTSSSTTSSPDLAHGADIRQALEEASGTLTLSYSTYLGGGDEDRSYGVAVDGLGCAYLAGMTLSLDFPTQDAIDGSNDGRGDVLVTKISASGSSLVYSTYLGGAHVDLGDGVSIDDSGCAYVVGVTMSSNFPTQRAFDSSYNGSWDVFATKLSAYGNSLVYSTYMGGSGDDYCQNGVALDAFGCAYVTGFTRSADFPCQNAFDSSYDADWDAFVTKFSASGNSLIYSTYLGGSEPDQGGSIAVDDSGCAYVAGYTKSPIFPTRNAFDSSHNGDWDVFVTKFSAAGDTLVYSTYLGGSSSDRALDIDIDDAGSVFVTGFTESLDFPTRNAYEISDKGGFDVFVTKFSASGNSLVYSTYLGGTGDDYGSGIAVDGSGRAYVAGETYSSDFPVRNAYQSDSGGDCDVFVTEFSAAGNSLVYSTYLGGSDSDWGRGIALDDSDCVYATGVTESPDFPTSNPYLTDQGGWDAFVAKLTWTPAYSCGDVNTDGKIDLLDAVFVINFIFVGEPAPQSLSLADVDCSGSFNIADVVFLIKYIFRSGPAPCAECE